MGLVYPDYYLRFSCIASACRHNCCVGWEIDVDLESLSRYRKVSGELGKKLRRCISTDDDTPHFVLDENEHCPFLKEDGLCELILRLGEDSLCEICAEHPRFRNFYGIRTEVGLGLCCEAAGALILGQKEPVRLLGAVLDEADDALVALRDEAVVLLQNRSRTIPERIDAFLQLYHTAEDPREMGEWIELLLSLEHLEPDWEPFLKEVADALPSVDLEGFAAHMQQRQTEYEQLLIYLVYRHLAIAEEPAQMAARARFAALGYRLLLTLGAVEWMRNGSFSFADQVELARRFSSELEYSVENLETILNALTPKTEE